MKKNQNIDVGFKQDIIRKTVLKMKMLVFVLIVGFSTVYGRSYSQETLTFTVKNATLQDIFQEITRQTGYNFVYSSNIIRQAGRITIKVEQQKLEEVLSECLRDTKLWYRLEEDFIIISPQINRPAAPQKSMVITGSVRDKKGLPMPGVSILLKETTIGVTTDNDGSFRLTIPEQNAPVLLFSFIGMKTQEITVKNTSSLTVTLEENVSEMNEVVVTGYYTLSKERSAGSFSTVQAQDIAIKTAPGIIERLDGLIPGFVVNNSGEDKYLLRGATSINSSRAPLFVVDGMPLELSTLESTVNPEDVASVNVLKDATASSIWGARAANGVIVITTKRGKNKENIKISYTGSVQLQGLPDFGYLDYMNARDYVDLAVNVFDPKFNYENTLNNYGTITPVERILYNRQNGLLSQEQADTELEKLRNSDNTRQIKDNLYRTKIVHQHNLNISGGSENTTYFLSVNYRNTKPQQKGINEDRLIIDLKNDFQILKWMKLSTGANITVNNNKSNYLPNAIGIIPYEPLIDPDGKHHSLQHTFYSDENMAWTNAELTKRNMSLFDFNILDELDRQKNTQKAINTRLQVALNLKLIDGLSFESRFQYQQGNSRNENLSKPESYRALNLRAQQTPMTAGSQSRIPFGAVMDQTTNNSTDWTARNQFLYEKTFAQKHSVNLLLGTEIRKNYARIDNRKMYGYNEGNKKYATLDEKALTAGVIGGSILRPTGNESDIQAFGEGFGTGFLDTDNRFFSLYTNLAYDYDSRYALNASVRMDQANLFGTGARYKPIWSVGAVWNVYKEKFFNTEILNRLSIRLSRGIAGNTPNSSVGGPYDIIAYQYFNNNHFAQTRPEVDIASPALKNLKWEKTNITNFGIDLSTLRGRLSGSIDVYVKKTNDLIGSRTIDPTNGFSAIQTNIGKMSNKGIEISLTSQNILHPVFRWETTLNFSYNKNKITDIYVTPTVTSYVRSKSPVFIQGYEAYSLFSYRWAGLDATGEPMVYNAEGKPTTEQVTDIDALVHSGTAQPPYSGSLANTFTWKDFRLSILAVYNFGNKLRNDLPGTQGGRLAYGNMYTDLTTLPANMPMHNDLKNMWKKAGDEAFTNIPRWLPQGETRINDDYWTAADIHIISGSYIAINDITLTYNLPKALTQKMRIRNCSVSAQVANPVCWVFNNEGVDPRYIGSMVGGSRTLRYGPEYMFKLNFDF